MVIVPLPIYGNANDNTQTPDSLPFPRIMIVSLRRNSPHRESQTQDRDH